MYVGGQFTIDGCHPYKRRPYKGPVYYTITFDTDENNDYLRQGFPLQLPIIPGFRNPCFLR